MNYIAIILGVIVILFLYILYSRYIKVNSLVSTTDLSTTQPTIPIANIPSRNSNRYSFGIWVYVNSWNTINKKYIISTEGNKFDLYLDNRSPVLHLNMNCTGETKATKQDIILTNNFPIQKWTYVIISVDNKIVDFYLDGKLVLSKQLPSLPDSINKDIKLGSGPGNTSAPDITITALNCYNEPIDPTTAWTNYLKGNGISNYGGAYNVNLSILKDSVVQSSYSLY